LMLLNMPIKIKTITVFTNLEMNMMVTQTLLANMTTILSTRPGPIRRDKIGLMRLRSILTKRFMTTSKLAARILLRENTDIIREMLMILTQHPPVHMTLEIISMVVTHTAFIALTLIMM